MPKPKVKAKDRVALHHAAGASCPVAVVEVHLLAVVDEDSAGAILSPAGQLGYATVNWRMRNHLRGPWKFAAAPEWSLSPGAMATRLHHRSRVRVRADAVEDLQKIETLVRGGAHKRTSARSGKSSAKLSRPSCPLELSTRRREPRKSSFDLP
jgi:hypothetical protein